MGFDLTLIVMATFPGLGFFLDTVQLTKILMAETNKVSTPSTWLSPNCLAIGIVLLGPSFNSHTFGKLVLKRHFQEASKSRARLNLKLFCVDADGDAPDDVIDSGDVDVGNVVDVDGKNDGGGGILCDKNMNGEPDRPSG